MNVIKEISDGMIILSIFAVIQQGCSVKDMADKAAKAHQKDLTDYGAYSRLLTGHKDSWVKVKK